MAKENIVKFEEKARNDEQLQKKIEEATKAFDGDKTDERTVFEAIIEPIAKEEGLEFTYDEVVELKEAAEKGEIDMEEMEAVSGGKLGVSTKDADAGCIALGLGFGAGVGAAGFAACYTFGIGFGAFFDGLYN